MLVHPTVPTHSPIKLSNHAQPWENNCRPQQQGHLPLHHEEENCNCRGKDADAERSRCLDSGTVYQADVTAQGKPKEQYVGIAAPPWKSRYGNHTASFRHIEKRKQTKLSGYVWSLKDEGIEPEVKWRILARCQPYRASSNTCRLCLREKYILMHKPMEATINGRDEFFSGCLHKHSLLL